MDGSKRRSSGQVGRLIRNARQVMVVIFVVLLVFVPILLVFGLIFRLIFLCGGNPEGC